MRGNILGLEVLGLPKLIDRFQVQGKTSYVILNQNSSAVVDSLVLRKYTSMAVVDEYFARVLTAVTGTKYATGDMIKVGERVWSLERLYNLREGFTSKEDTLPARLLNEPAPDGPTKGWVVHLEPMLKEHYRTRGWASNGVPTAQKLAELELKEFGQ